MKRPKAYFRWQRKRAIKRKLDILHGIGGEDFVYAWTRGACGRLVKGKIHCSCHMCRRKSDDEPSYKDKKAHICMKQKIAEYH